MGATTRRPRKARHEDGPLELYFEDIRRYPLLERSEEAQLGRRIRAGDAQALDRLVRSNLRFVVSVAKRYQNLGVPLPDLIAEGNVGLVRAARLFDPERSVRFISYAVWWIRQAILLTLDQHTRDSRRTSPLDAPRFPDDELSPVETVPDDRAPNPLDRALGVALERDVRIALSSLDPREARVIRLYFGLDGNQPLTLEEIASVFGLSRERVRQIKERALGRLRRVRRARRLQPYFL